MNSTVLLRRPVRGGAILISGCLLLTACAGSSSKSASSQAGLKQSGHGALAAPAPAGRLAQNGAAGSAAVETAGLAPANVSIVYTASMTVRSADVATAAERVTAIVVAAGGYIADEQASSAASGPVGRTIDLTLKIPVASYQVALAQLSSPALGKQISMQQQATDVTQQVANVNSLVTSEQAAINALQRLLNRAASVSGLLQVQQQISSDESTLNSLLAQQRALDHETSYATVTMTLVSTPRHQVAHRKSGSHGFVAGLSAGWRALRDATGAVLTALGAALPFLIVIVILAGLGYAGWRRFAKRGARPTAAS